MPVLPSRANDEDAAPTASRAGASRTDTLGRSCRASPSVRPGSAPTRVVSITSEDMGSVSSAS